MKFSINTIAVLLSASLITGVVQAKISLTDSDIAELNVTQAAQLIKQGELSSSKLVEVLAERIAANQQLNAFISVDIPAAVKASREADAKIRAGETVGPLHGVPLVIKDNIDVQGLPNTAGTLALIDHRPQTDAPVVAALRKAGAIILGKTNMHELAFGITSDNRAFGSVRNPYNQLTFAGGSSGGTAAAVAARLAPAGLGTDTGGSARIPSALNGLVGFRPTVGRYAQSGITPISHTRDTAGPIARQIADVALLDGVMSGSVISLKPASLKALRLGVPRHYFYNNLDQAVASRVESVLNRLRKAGVVLVEADLTNIGSLNEKVGFPLAIYEVLRGLPKYLEGTQPKVTLEEVIAGIASPDVKFVLGQLAIGKDGKVGTEDDAIPTKVYQDAISIHRPALQALYQDYFKNNQVDAILFPTTILPARLIQGSGERVDLNGQRVPTFGTYIQNTDPGSNAGIPGLTLPIGLSPEGLPIGLELDAPMGADQRLLEIGLAIESILDPMPGPVLGHR